MPEPKKLYRQVAKLHIIGINQGFLRMLGEDFLALLYEAIDTCPNGILLTEIQNDQVIGFVAGADGLKPIYRQMLRCWPRLTLALAPVFLSPRKIWRIIEIMRHSFRANKEEFIAGKAKIPSFELLSIAISPNERRRGIAQRLYRRLIVHAREIEAHSFRIVVGDDLMVANQFYTSMGALPIGQISVHGEDKSTVYVQLI